MRTCCFIDFGFFGVEMSSLFGAVVLTCLLCLMLLYSAVSFLILHESYYTDSILTRLAKSST